MDIGAEDNQGAAYFFGNERGGATPSVEGAPIILTSPLKLLNGSFQFSFTNTPGRLLTALVSTNIALPLSNWASLGSLTGTSPGQFQFTDPQATNGPHCFYRVRSPWRGTSIRALDANSGTGIWTNNLPGNNSISPPTYNSGAVYNQQGQGVSASYIRSFDAANGHTNWETSFVATRYRGASAASSPPTPSSSASTFNASSGRC